MIKAGLGPSYVKKEVMPNCCRSADGRSPAQIHAKRVFLAFKPSSQFNGEGSLMILRKVPQKSEEADFTEGLCGEMGVLTKLRTAWKGEEQRNNLPALCGLILGSCK